ncbi:MAG: ferrous iron transport protein A [Lachnospiraceae bacterium]|nr:ferrous iron transport protein A [Lachnospiraceae bacterium]
MPLTLAAEGEEVVVKKLNGLPEVKQHLEDMGFVPGGAVTVVSKNDGNLIVKVKESRLAVSKELAAKIMI